MKIPHRTNTYTQTVVTRSVISAVQQEQYLTVIKPSGQVTVLSIGTNARFVVLRKTWKITVIAMRVIQPVMCAVIYVA